MWGKSKSKRNARDSTREEELKNALEKKQELCLYKIDSSFGGQVQLMSKEKIEKLKQGISNGLVDMIYPKILRIDLTDQPIIDLTQKPIVIDFTEDIQESQERKQIKIKEEPQNDSDYELLPPKNTKKRHRKNRDNKSNRKNTNKKQKIPKSFLNACKSNDENKVKRLIDSKAEGINDEDENGMIPLFWAVKKSNIEILKLLFKNGAKIEKINMFGNTVLHWAAGIEIGQNKTKEKIFKILLSYCDNKVIDMQNKNEQENTPLIIAVLNKNNGAFNALLEYKANVNIKNKDGKTALDYAIQGYSVEKNRKNLNFIQSLLQHNADVLHRNVILKKNDRLNKLLREHKQKQEYTKNRLEAVEYKLGDRNSLQQLQQDITDEAIRQGISIKELLKQTEFSELRKNLLNHFTSTEPVELMTETKGGCTYTTKIFPDGLVIQKIVQRVNMLQAFSPADASAGNQRQKQRRVEEIDIEILEPPVIAPGLIAQIIPQNSVMKLLNKLPKTMQNYLEFIRQIWKPLCNPVISIDKIIKKLGSSDNIDIKFFRQIRTMCIAV